MLPVSVRLRTVSYTHLDVYKRQAVKALSDGLRIDLVDTPLRVTNIKPGMVEKMCIRDSTYSARI